MSCLYLFMGFPFTGKSTVAKQLKLPLIEVDEVRKSLTGTYEPLEGSSSLVADVVYQSAKHYLEKKSDIVIEGMFLTESSRIHFVELANKYDASIEIHWFDPSFSWIKHQLSTSSTPKTHVTFSYIETLSRNFEYPTVEEGFDQFYYYTEKDFDKI